MHPDRGSESTSIELDVQQSNVLMKSESAQSSSSSSTGCEYLDPYIFLTNMASMEFRYELCLSSVQAVAAERPSFAICEGQQTTAQYLEE
jgi:hypothetical protein